ncbi:hypothetical protein ON010_g12732 [Phytophthora cinnamomi]|nr:hypothetical protein ON010_g12732 [Phytophthora cinnamomi]
MLVGCHIKVYTRYSVLRSIFTSSSLEGCCQRWATLLSPWDLEIHRVEKAEDGLAAIMGAGITPREHLANVAESLNSKKGTNDAFPADKPGYIGKLWLYPMVAAGVERGQCERYFLEDVTVNDAEYQVLIKGVTLAMEHGVFDLLFYRIPHRHSAGSRVSLIHVTREFNQAADYRTSRTLAAGESQIIDDPLELSHLHLVNRVPEKLVKPHQSEDEDPRVDGDALCCVLKAIVDDFPNCDNAPLTLGARVLAALTRSHVSPQPQVTEASGTETPGLASELTAPLPRRPPKWPSSDYEDARALAQCVNCASGKGKPPNPGPSPGNIEPNVPARKHLSLAIPIHVLRIRDVQTHEFDNSHEAYEEAVFRQFGASSMPRHDRDHRFLSEVFPRFREMFGTKQRATLAYRPQANGQQERYVQTMVRRIRAYVAEADPSDGDDHAERLVIALNTSFASTRLETPFYLVHGWDAKSTVSAVLGPPPTGLGKRSAYERRHKLQRDYTFAHAWARDLQTQAKRLRAGAQTQRWLELSERLKTSFQVGDSVWLYLAREQPGLTKAYAHMWHGPFRIED